MKIEDKKKLLANIILNDNSLTDEYISKRIQEFLEGYNISRYVEKIDIYGKILEDDDELLLKYSGHFLFPYGEKYKISDMKYSVARNLYFNEKDIPCELHSHYDENFSNYIQKNIFAEFDITNNDSLNQVNLDLNQDYISIINNEEEIYFKFHKSEMNIQNWKKLNIEINNFIEKRDELILFSNYIEDFENGKDVPFPSFKSKESLISNIEFDEINETDCGDNISINNFTIFGINFQYDSDYKINLNLNQLKLIASICEANPDLILKLLFQETEFFDKIGNEIKTIFSCSEIQKEQMKESLEKTSDFKIITILRILFNLTPKHQNLKNEFLDFLEIKNISFVKNKKNDYVECSWFNGSIVIHNRDLVNLEYDDPDLSLGDEEFSFLKKNLISFQKELLQKNKIKSSNKKESSLPIETKIIKKPSNFLVKNMAINQCLWTLRNSTQPSKIVNTLNLEKKTKNSIIKALKLPETEAVLRMFIGHMIFSKNPELGEYQIQRGQDD